MRENDIRSRVAYNKYLEILYDDNSKIFNKTEFIKVNCPACSSNAVLTNFEKMGFYYTQCANCKTIYVNPRPTLEAINKFYSDSEAEKFWVNEFFMPVAEARRLKIFKPRAQEISKEFEECCKGRIGDIGAGFGLFLDEIRKIWTQAEFVAIEPSKEMAQICEKKELQVINKMLEDVEADINGNFDMLTSFELFEHLYNPRAFLSKVVDLLKPGGWFILTTLNGMGFDIQLLWEKAKSFSPPQHLNFFNPQSIKKIFEECGLTVKNITTPGRLDWDIVEGMYKDEGIAIGRFWENVVESETSTKDELQSWISKNNFSSHMRIVAKKE